MNRKTIRVAQIGRTFSALWWCISIALFPSVCFAAAQGEMTKLLMDITSGPQEYYTPDAYSYFTAKGEQLPPQQSLKEARRSFKAAMEIAAMGPGGSEALNVLVEKFPRGIHVTETNNLRYTGEGSFDDWVQTYVTSEKNKFVLSSPFLDYNTMSQCEQFIVSTHQITRLSGEPVTIPTRDPVRLSVIHTVYFGAFAISRITGESFGIDSVQWRQWWYEKGGSVKRSLNTSAATPGDLRFRSGQYYKDIVVRGKYRMYLSTGDNFTGRVESKTDESLILETSEGKAYTFKPSIIIRYEYLEPPQPSVTNKKVPAGADTLPFSFDELRGKRVGNRQIEVRIKSGMVFRGILTGIDEKEMKLTVGGSAIPITRDVVVNIRMVPKTSPPPAPAQKKTSSAPKAVDTVVQKNTKTDDWGVPGPDIVHTGIITTDNPQGIVISTNDGKEKRIPRAQILRVVKNSTESYETIIKRYAQPLFCPDDMFFVDLPPGTQGRPFFKVCVDRYEYPNVKGARPKTGISYDDAKTLCSKRGKRLCTADEWQWACSGMEGYTYPYGWNPDKDKCNTDGARPPEESGSRHNCVGKFGGYDMVGNVFEWVTGPKKQPALMGGPHSKCQTITEGVGGSAKPNTGLRCCKSN